ncbi:carboxylesterase/lipase family protein [Yinghuangia seranimata]|uniref:carboxylesterase/lipase family protein n=1 Tax=Yinghuangia seranimata TaxID=408067 RepID=UPI00248C45F2|nr:carboxylesterase family protein [Yinghuangia seranimata]MDI2127050.1 carboxylesterase family protein [Yinghuangia seranimata]
MASIAHSHDAQPSDPLGEAPVVQTPAGAVRGTMLGDSNAAYLGIPYAEAPIGDLRFAAPVKRAPWDGVRDASSYGATPLRDYMMGVTLIPEPSFPGDDTLLVNVFTPKPGDTSAKLPVFVWIHGGGFVSGSPSSPWYEGGAFPRDGVVVVSVSYRLGVDGFGRLEGAPDNRAVRDWLLALEWVQESIAAFGGDPDKVTIGGQSAGGSAVLTLLSMPKAQHLFRAVVSESPGAFGSSREAAVARAATFAKRLGVSPTREAFAALDEDVVFKEQAKMSDEEMGPQMMKGLTGADANGVSAWAPFVDGDLVPYSFQEAVERGVGADKPLLIGATAGEFEMVSTMMPAPLDWLPRRVALRLAGFSGARGRTYGAATPGKPRLLFGRVMTDFLFRFFVARTLAARSAKGGAGTFAYDFRFQSAGNGFAGHCIELPFAWDCLDSENVPANTGDNPPQDLADTTHAAWVAFIRDGEPGWQAYDTKTRQGMVFDRQSRETEVYTRESDLSASMSA